MSATPSSAGKGQPGRATGPGTDSSASNGNGAGSGNGGQPSSSGANSTLSSAIKQDDAKVETAVAANTPAEPPDEAKTEVTPDTPPVGSSAPSPSSAGSPSPGSSSPGSSPLGSSPLGKQPKGEPAKDYSPPWTTSSEPPGSVSADRVESSTKPSISPFGQDAGAPRSASSSPSGSAGTAFRNRVNDVMRPGKTAAEGKSPRKAHLQVSRFEPWSVMKFSFVMSLVCFIVLLVAVAVIYMILSGLGVFDQIVQTINELTQDKGSTTKSSFDAGSWFSFTRIFGYTALVGALNVLLITALATVWSVIYNIAADFVGGVEVTLKEAE